MKIHRIDVLSAIVCVALMSSTGCGPIDEEVQPTSEEALGTVDSELTIYPCGTGCPSGYYPTATAYSYSCGSSYGNTYTTCNYVSGSTIYSCGTGCPSNYYPTATAYSYSCGSSYGNTYTTCNYVSGSPVYVCGTGCPSGYYPTATAYSYSCGAAYGNRYTTCWR